MDKQPQHDSLADHTVEVDLGALVLRAADAIEEHVEEAATMDISRALSLRHHPSVEELAALTSRLITHCATFANGVAALPAAARTVRGTHALETWAQLREDGPEAGPLGNWSYCRHLALAARDMMQALRDHRGASFVGRTDMPPLIAGPQ